MTLRPLHPFSEVLLIEPVVHHDDRGSFRELFREDYFRQRGEEIRIAQLNYSTSRKGVLRGLHFQHPSGQGKIVGATSGVIYDVAVDVRVGSPTFACWTAHEISAESGEQVYIPPGFAHGYLALTEGAEVLYACTASRRAEAEHVLAWDDPEVGVSWPMDGLDAEQAALSPILSQRDRVGSSLSELREASSLPAFGA